MTAGEPFDLLHQGAERVIGAYLLETSEGPALFDCGPTSTVDTLKQRLDEQGLELGDIRHLLLSHVHLDHAGAAGVLVREHPSLQVYVSEIGAPHLVDPSRLERSARRLYGDRFDSLWGELAPVPEERINVVGDRALDLECFPAPGHATHHVIYIDGEGTAFCGDAAGVRIQPSRFVVPPTPPPDIDVEAWNTTLDELERRAPERLALIHFGVATDVGPHLSRLRACLANWAEIVGDGATEEEFVARALEQLSAAGGDDAAIYQHAIPMTQSYAGLRRYWDKRSAT